MPYGYTGKILRVNLTSKDISVEEHDDEFYRRYMGGRALVAYYLLREVPAGTDAFSPDNLLILAPGVVTGAMVSGAGRNGAGAVSPLNGGFGNAEGGGFWGAELKRAGFDAVIIKGRAQQPVYLWIKDGHAELRDASHLWGKLTGDTEDLIREELGDPGIRTCLIGPAGENLVRFACLVNDRTHFPGRTGLGAVMGSKNLKGVAARGTPNNGLFEVFDKKGVLALAKWMSSNLDLVSGLHEHGTAGGTKGLSLAGGLPTQNFQEGSFEGADDITGEVMTDKILVSRDTCFACAVRCKRVVRADEPFAVDPGYGGPEYETVGSFGSSLGVDNLVAIAKANELCAAYGLDTISTGMTIAHAMELWQRGIIDSTDTGGMDLSWGNYQSVIKLVNMIVDREGFGDELAEGSYRFSKKNGPEALQYLMHVKGQELPMHEPRIKHSLGVGYSLSPTGADHMHNMHDTAYTRSGRSLEKLNEFGDFKPLPATELSDDKMEMFFWHTNWRHFLDSIGMCHFVPYDAPQMVDLVNACTGWDTDKWELQEVGQRASTMARAVNIKFGLGAETDTLPDRFFKAFDKTDKGEPLDREAWAQGKKHYYSRMGWDVETGVPQPKRLEELGVGWIADILED